MKKLLFVVALLGRLTVQAQRTNPPMSTSPSKQYEYVVLSMDGAADRHPYLQYGQDGKPAVSNPSLAQENLIVSKIGSGIAALNYLCSRGWEYVSVSPSVGGSAGHTSTATEYLLRRLTP